MIQAKNNILKNHPVLWLAGGLIVAGLVFMFFNLGMVGFIREWLDAQSALARQFPNRGIDTVGQLWKNGYLRFFFNYELFGYLPALGLPALIAFLATMRGRPRWQKALVFTWCLSAVLIGAKGYINLRYAFTLTPFIIVFILFMAWTLSRRRFVRAILLGLVCVLAAYSYRVQAQSERYRRYIGELSSAPKADRLPYEFIEYLNQVSARTNSRVLVMGDAWPHYYTRCRAINYNHPDILQALLWAKGDCLTRLLKDHSIRYLASDDGSDIYLRSYTSLKNFTDLARTRTVALTEGSFSLRCIEPELTRSEIEALTRQGLNLISNGSFGSPSDPSIWFSPWRIYAGSGSEPPRMEYESDAGKGARCAVLSGENFHLVQDVRSWADLKGQTVTVFVRMKTAAPDMFALELYDGVGFARSFHPGHGEWMTLGVTLPVSLQADRLEIRAVSASRTGAKKEVRVDGVILVKGKWLMPKDILEKDNEKYGPQ